MLNVMSRLAMVIPEPTETSMHSDMANKGSIGFGPRLTTGSPDIVAGTNVIGKIYVSKFGSEHLK